MRSTRSVLGEDATQRSFSAMLPAIVFLLCLLAIPGRSFAQCCAPEPFTPMFWVNCGLCRGDLNDDGRLNNEDRIKFEEFRNTQNPCADLNDDGAVNNADLNILDCLIEDSNGSCSPCPPQKLISANWVCCGECRGDLNGDGLLNELDQLLFAIYASQSPQNACADFNDNGVVDLFDQQILNCLINTSNGSCRSECGDPIAGSCFEASEPNAPIPGGCDDPVCCTTVCLADPLCCIDIWDNGCVSIAESLCLANSPTQQADAGNSLLVHFYEEADEDCLNAQNTPNCPDANCNTLVCTLDPICCATRWDLGCADLARVHCQSPCTNVLVQEAVCASNPGCCTTGNWDVTCTILAMTFLSSPDGQGISTLPRHFLLAPVPEPTLLDPTPFTRVLSTYRTLLCNVDPAYCGDLAFFGDIFQALSIIGINYQGCVSQFADGVWDADCAQVAARLIREPGAGASGLGSCLAIHQGGGCEDAYCTSLVCRLDPTCCDEQWDVDCVNLAAIQCILVPSSDLASASVRSQGATSIEDPDGFGCGSNAAGNCSFSSLSPYCRDAACCQLICSYEAFCCETQWDEFCAVLANNACSIAVSCGPVAVLFPPYGRSCTVARNPAAQYPAGCENPSCCNTICSIDTFCCEVLWDQFCADGAEELCVDFQLCTDTNESCFDAHATPSCNDTNCCEDVCAVDPVCCLTAWDQNCVVQAFQLCTGCGSPYSGSCATPHPGAGCSNQDCCEAVCDIDPFCCREEWDGSCVVITSFYPSICDAYLACGNPDARNCFVASFGPGCSDSACCKTICQSFDPWCCEVRWDAICATQALSACSLPFNTGGRDPCDQASPTGRPGCNDDDCTAAVCSIPGLEKCCTSKWDAACAAVAREVCIGLYECPGEGDCEKSKTTPMCDDPACCNAVCVIDPTCCSLIWDNGCAQEAIRTCRVPSGSNWECPCEGSCFEARPLDAPRPGCDNESCCAAVCTVDDTCCTVNWDEQCTEIATDYCSGGDVACGSFSSGGCLTPSETPFCDDSACCDSVCAVDPSCCVNRWDSYCVAIAIDRCRRGCGIASAGSCFYPHLTPGCSEAECCEAICTNDPICCEVVWDGTCAQEAIDTCDPGECGDFPAGDCCTVNFSPSCNDKRCCNDVCATDSFCCDTTWDSACVELARQSTRCSCGANSNCGDPCAGSCCLPNGTPKCDDEDCCDAVCADDSYCCDVEWDLVCAGMALNDSDCTGPMDSCPSPECGDPDAGDCCFPNGTPGCSDATCCQDVCDDDPFCCDSNWDTSCAQRAQTACVNICDSNLSCGSRDTGPCNVPHDGPYCDDTACCEQVCLLEPFCCLGDWDEFCVLLAQTSPSCN